MYLADSHYVGPLKEPCPSPQVYCHLVGILMASFKSHFTVLLTQLLQDGETWKDQGIP